MDIGQAHKNDFKAAEPDLQAVLDNISYEEACSYFQFISASSPERQTGSSALPFKPTPIQTKSVAWMYRMRHETELNGAILALGTGCGKTAASVAFLETESKRITEETVLPYKPHLVVCPVSLIPNWLSEFNDHFSQSGLLKMWALESREKGGLARYDLSIEQLIAAKCGHGGTGGLILDPTDKETAKTIILVSYNRLAQMVVWAPEQALSEVCHPTSPE
ncbi:hypothetical protein BKA80DRAFT_254050 [Phyllosticta citrichinensis]